MPKISPKLNDCSPIRPQPYDISIVKDTLMDWMIKAVQLEEHADQSFRKLETYFFKNARQMTNRQRNTVNQMMRA